MKEFIDRIAALEADKAELKRALAATAEQLTEYEPDWEPDSEAAAMFADVRAVMRKHDMKVPAPAE